MRPELPVNGPGRGGRVGASATQHVVQNLVRDTMRDEDVSGFQYATALNLPAAVQPREALLRIGAQVDNDPKWTKGMFILLFSSRYIDVSITAWTKNQPKPVFQQTEEEKEED